MLNRSIQCVAAVSLLLISTQFAKASDQPLASWQFAQNIDLTDAMLQDSRLDVMFAGDLLLISHPNLDSDDGCGSVLVMSQDQNGRFNTLRTLSAADFNRDCIEPDGFGFSMDYAGELLVIGAPEQVFIEPGEVLQRGAVYVYSLDASSAEAALGSLQPLDRIGGTFQRGNVAWGTRVKTDGERILVQGNETGSGHIAHGRAVSRTVNLLEPDTTSTWRLTQQFTDDTSLYGHDFLIDQQRIVINSHVFTGFNPGEFPLDPANFYDTTLEIYLSESDVGTAVLQQTISITTSVPRIDEGNDRIQERDQLFWQEDRLVVFTTHYDLSISGEIIWYQLDQDNQFEQLSITQRFSVSRANIEVGESFVFSRGGLGLAGTVDSYIPSVPTAEQFQEQLIPGRNNRGIFLGELFDTVNLFRLNASADRLLLIGEQQGERQLSVFRTIPALDPAITGTWWFGPQFDGQGITLEVLLGNRLLLHWFTYDLSGRQMWLRGVGTLENGTIQMPIVRPRGPRFPIGEFNPDDRNVEQWGTVEISFSDCRNGLLSYQSDEFGTDSLPISLLTDNDYICNRGLLVNSAGEVIQRGGTSDFAGSSFDESRAGEGFIFMPIASNGRVLDFEGFWLTYTQLGAQAWYYLGRLERLCPLPEDRRNCGIRSVDQPRRPTGPVFGPDYDPADREITPWGVFGPIISERGGSRRVVSFSNPDGFGRLFLQDLTTPVGY